MSFDITGLGSLADFAGKIIDKVWPDPGQAAAAKLKFFEAQQAGQFKEMDQAFALAQSQIGVNAIEAASTSLFVSGWRPAIGWICGAALGYKFVFAPLIAFLLGIFWKTVDLPVLDFSEMSTVLMGLLGLGAMRTVEKIKGVA